MYHVTTVEMDDDGNLYVFHQISCSQLSEAARFADHWQRVQPMQPYGMTIIETVIEGEPESGLRPIGDVVQPIVERVRGSKHCWMPLPEPPQ